MTTLIISHESYLTHDTGPYHPESPDRLRSVLKALDQSALKGFIREEAPEATAEQIARAHPGSYVDYVLAAIPTAERRERWENMAQGGFTAEEIEEAYGKMRKCLTDLESAMEKGPWLAGETYSLADIAIVPFIDRIRNLRPEFMPVVELPRANDWYDRMKARPSFDKAFNFKDDPRAAELPNL